MSMTSPQAPAAPQASRHPAVSVVLATYNGSRFLEQAIVSVLAQTCRDYQFIIIDDGSTDPQVRAICDRYADRIEYVYQENRGLAGARNAGIARARGEYICFIDDDDAWKPEKLAKQLAFMRSFRPEENVAMASTWLDLVDPEGRLIGRQGHDLSGDVHRRLLFESPVDAPSSVMIRRDVFAAVGPYDESLRYAEDRDMWLRISRRYRLRSLNEHLVYYRVRPGSMSRNTEGQARDILAGLERTFEECRDDPEVQALRPRAMASLHLRWAVSRFYQADGHGCREHFRTAREIRPGSATRYHRLLYLASYLGDAPVRGFLRTYRMGKGLVQRMTSLARPVVLHAPRQATAAARRRAPRVLRLAAAAMHEALFLVRLSLSFALLPVRWLLPPQTGIALYNVLWRSARRTDLDSLANWYEYDHSIAPYLSLAGADTWLEGRCVVDMGAGSGGKAISCLRERARSVIAIEIDEHRLREARALTGAHLTVEQQGHLTLLRASAYQLPIRDETVDTVVSYTVFEHLSRPREALAEAFRVLRPGGQVLLYYHFFCSPYGAHLVQFVRFPWPTRFFRGDDLVQHYSGKLVRDQARGLCQATFPPGVGLAECTHDHFVSLNRLPPEEFESLLTDRPWQVVKAGYYGPRRALMWLGKLRPAWRKYAHDGKYYLLRKP
jgi:SAM-dependent methyltransferase